MYFVKRVEVCAKGTKRSNVQEGFANTTTVKKKKKKGPCNVNDWSLGKEGMTRTKGKAGSGRRKEGKTSQTPKPIVK
jgi:hypothetical protein